MLEVLRIDVLLDISSTRIMHSVLLGVAPVLAWPYLSRDDFWTSIQSWRLPLKYNTKLNMMCRPSTNERQGQPSSNGIDNERDSDSSEDERIPRNTGISSPIADSEMVSSVFAANKGH